MGTGSSRDSGSGDLLQSLHPDHVPTAAPAPQPRSRPTRAEPAKTLKRAVSKEEPEAAEETEPVQDDLEDIEDLEKTFDSLGIHRRKSSTKVEEPNAVEVEEEKKEKRQDVAIPSTSAVSDSGESAVQSLPGPTTATLKTVGQRSVKSPFFKQDSITKLTPQKLPSEESPNDWVYLKKDIDGFDPEKFRKANKRESTPEGDSPILFLRTEVTTHNPYRFPEYDVSDEELLAGIERELIT